VSAIHKTKAPTYVFLGVEMKILLSSDETGGQFSMIEGIMPPGGDGGLHIHEREDETMHLLEGELEVSIGERVFTLKAGETYFAPRNVPQRLRNLTSRPARTIMVATPGGFDRFIAAVAAPAGAPQTPPTPEQMHALLELTRAFGIQILVPPGA
jgi:mannose-6-phosphate isomerase-like protein (cupin superfamily)